MTFFSKHLGALAAGVAASVLLAGAALADPAIIYDLGGKFDKSFNEAAFNGAEAWKKATGGNYTDLELQNDAQREQALRRFASQGAQPIVMAGFSWGTALTTVAAEFPDTHFIVYAPNGAVLNPSDGPMLNWSGILPANGDYQIEVVSMTRVAHYTLDVTIR